MASITSLQDFQLYQEAVRLFLIVYKLCKQLQAHKEFSLADQLKRASLSVAANLAEGFGRATQKDFSHFLSMSLGSANEVLVYFDVIEKIFPDIRIGQSREEYQVIGKRIYTFRKTLQKA